MPVIPKHLNPDYLDLLEKILLYTFWPQDHIDWHGKPQNSLITPEEYETGMFWPQYAFTMVNRLRLRNVRDICLKAVEENIPGGFAECGVWRGGVCIYARACMPEDRTIYVCDSFAGFPPDEPQVCWIDLKILIVPLNEVQSNFKKFGLDQNVKFVAGWFNKGSLQGVDGPLAVLRLDGDSYRNTFDILTNLWPKLSPGGYVICDDYICVPESKQAFIDYFGSEPRHNIVDGSAIWFKKEQ